MNVRDLFDDDDLFDALSANQRRAGQMGPDFRPRSTRVLGTPTDPANPNAGKLVGEDHSMPTMDKAKIAYMTVVVEAPLGTPSSDFIRWWQHELSKVNINVSDAQLQKLMREFNGRTQQIHAELTKKYGDYEGMLSYINEADKEPSLRNPEDNPCWKGYKPVGTKKKGGKTVPNCVPKESVGEGQLNEASARDVILSLLDKFYADMKLPPRQGGYSGELDIEGPGTQVWTRGDGTRYRKPGSIKAAYFPDDKKQAEKAAANFWPWLLKQPGVKTIGQVSGEFGSDPMKDAVSYKGLYFSGRPGGVEFGSLSRYKNPRSVWRQKKDEQGVAEGLTPQQKQAHQANLDAAQREMDRREAEGEDMTGAKIDQKTYEIRKPKQSGVAEGSNREKEENFTIDDIKRLEKIRDLETLKAQAKELIKGKPARRMKPEKISWFYNHIDTLKNPLAVIKMMYDLMLAGEGHKVIGTRNSMSSNSYRSRFGEQTVAEGQDQDSPVANAILQRIMMRHQDLLGQYGPEAIMAAADEIAGMVGEVDEIGTSDVSGWVQQVGQVLTSQDMVEGNVLKSIRRGMAGWDKNAIGPDGQKLGDPREVVRRANSLDTDTAKKFRAGLKNPSKHSPAGLQKRALDRKLKGIEEGKKHVSPSGVETNMDPSDDDYAINYGKKGGVAKFRRSQGLDVKTGKKKTGEDVEEAVAGPEKCWKGYRKVGTKPGTGKNAGKRVNDCEKIKESVAVNPPKFPDDMPEDEKRAAWNKWLRTQTKKSVDAQKDIQDLANQLRKRKEQSVQEAESEMDSPEFQEKLANLKKKAALGPMKTVFNPVTGKYRNVPDDRKQSGDVKESVETTYEEVLDKLKARLGDYLKDVADAVADDGEIVNDRPPGDQVDTVKTVVTDDGHEIRIHGNEDDGFRITIKNQQANAEFANLEEAEMAAEMYCKRRRQSVRNSSDYVSEGTKR